jgi:hypothetical protein
VTDPRPARRGRRLGAVLTGLLAAGVLAVPLLDRVAAPDTAGAATPVAATAAASTAGGATSGTGTSSSPVVDDAALAAQVDAAAGAADGTISVVVLDAAGDELFEEAPQTATYTASLVKLLVVEQLLVDDEAGTVELTSADLALMERAIEASDDEAMDTLWVRYDGADLVAAAATRLGLTATNPPTTAGQWGQTTTTAADVATALATIGDSLDADDAATFLGWLRSTTASAADGFDQEFGVLAGATTGAIAAKQGWMCCVDAQRQLHSAGLLADGRVVVLLGDFSAGTSWSAAATALDTAAAAVVTATG